MSVCAIDIETTGLDPSRGSIWEIALIVDGAEYMWRLDVDLSEAEPAALRVNRYYQRAGDVRPTEPAIAARQVARLTAGRHLVGAAPWFDAGFLEPWLRSYGQCPAWSHRLVCVETFAAGALGLEEPLSLSATAEKLGVAVPEECRHTALGDARAAMAVYRAALARGEGIASRVEDLGDALAVLGLGPEAIEQGPTAVGPGTAGDGRIRTPSRCDGPSRCPARPEPPDA
jgi:DNA polymerase-3 subunit epsilon